MDWFLAFLFAAMYVATGWIVLSNMRAWAVANGNPRLRDLRMGLGFAISYSVLWAPMIGLVAWRLAREVLAARRAG